MSQEQGKSLVTYTKKKNDQKERDVESWVGGSSKKPTGKCCPLMKIRRDNEKGGRININGDPVKTMRNQTLFTCPMTTPRLLYDSCLSIRYYLLR